VRKHIVRSLRGPTSGNHFHLGDPSRRQMAGDRHDVLQARPLESSYYHRPWKPFDRVQNKHTRITGQCKKLDKAQPRLVSIIEVSIFSPSKIILCCVSHRKRLHSKITGISDGCAKMRSSDGLELLDRGRGQPPHQGCEGSRDPRSRE
jgi:hypothetical protein